MNSRSRELLILLVAAGVAVFLLRNRDIPSLTSLSSLFAEEEPAELVVWSGEKPAGKTWANLGIGGGIDYLPESGLRGKGQALTIRFGGEGYRGCGLNWKGWFPEDAADDASRYRSLVFHVRQTGELPGLDLQVSLVDNQKHG